jgi:hypothetical protein
VKKIRLVWLSLAFLATGASLSGCGRAHLSSNFAQAYTAWFTVQHVKAKGSPEDSRRIIESLDAAEAGAVSKTYRKTVSKGGEESSSRMLMIGAPRGGGGDGYVPPPSVPGQ